MLWYLWHPGNCHVLKWSWISWLECPAPRVWTKLEMSAMVLRLLPLQLRWLHWLSALGKPSCAVICLASWEHRFTQHLPAILASPLHKKQRATLPPNQFPISNDPDDSAHPDEEMTLRRAWRSLRGKGLNTFRCVKSWAQLTLFEASFPFAWPRIPGSVCQLTQYFFATSLRLKSCSNTFQTGILTFNDHSWIRENWPLVSLDEEVGPWCLLIKAWLQEMRKESSQLLRISFYTGSHPALGPSKLRSFLVMHIQWII